MDRPLFVLGSEDDTGVGVVTMAYYPGVTPTLQFRDPAYLARDEPMGVPVRVDEGGIVVTVSVPVIRIGR